MKKAIIAGLAIASKSTSADRQFVEEAATL
jgi:hypothetical protein